MKYCLMNAFLLFQQQAEETKETLTENLTKGTEIDLWPAFLNMIFVLAIVVGCIILLGWIMKKITGRAGGFGGSGFMSVISTLPLGDRRVLTVVKVGSRYFLMGISPGSINNLAELSEEEVEKVVNEKEPPTDTSFSRILRKMTGGEEEKPQ
jgi:flagellar biosynthetic protein FliO